MTWAVVPIKSLTQAKGRLAPRLNAEQRRVLVLAMLEDVLTALRQAPPIHSILLVSADPDALALGLRLGARPLLDEAGSLNGALEQAARHAADAGAESLLVIPGDLPLLSGADITGLLAGGTARHATIAPSHDGGTSALFLRPPRALPFLFGPDSFRRHLAAAQGQGLSPRVYHAPGPSLDDIDTPADLARLASHNPGGATARLLRSALLY
jgi:2-phospho-L-lactate guanylyltransferase